MKNSPTKPANDRAPILLMQVEASASGSDLGVGINMTPRMMMAPTAMKIGVAERMIESLQDQVKKWKAGEVEFPIKVN